MIVDADAGMPLDLLQWEGLWDQQWDDSRALWTLGNDFECAANFYLQK